MSRENEIKKVRSDFNFLVTSRRGEEFQAALEVRNVFHALGDDEVKVKRASVRGLLKVKTKLNPLNAAEKISDLVKEGKLPFVFTLRYIPIQKVVPTNLEAMKEAVKKLSIQFLENETFRVTVEKRRTNLHSREIILSLAELIPRKVDLKKPDKVLLVEVVGEKTGLSVLKPNQIVSTMKQGT